MIGLALALALLLTVAFGVSVARAWPAGGPRMTTRKLADRLMVPPVEPRAIEDEWDRASR